jgi:hypothetical protein
LEKIEAIIEKIQQRKEWREQCETVFNMSPERVTEIELGRNLPKAVQKYIRTAIHHY